jgi:hypothetical protein
VKCCIIDFVEKEYAMSKQDIESRMRETDVAMDVTNPSRREKLLDAQLHRMEEIDAMDIGHKEKFELMKADPLFRRADEDFFSPFSYFRDEVAEVVMNEFPYNELLGVSLQDVLDTRLLRVIEKYVELYLDEVEETEDLDVDAVAAEILTKLQSTTRISPTIPVYIGAMLVSLAGGQRQIGAYLTKVVKYMWFASLFDTQPDAQSSVQPSAQSDVQSVGILERIEANQQLIIANQQRLIEMVSRNSDMV